ncbi:MAG: ECF transporter S component [archaeon]
MLRKKAGERQSYYQSDNEEQNSRQKLGLFALQKQLQVLRQKELLLVISFISAGVLGRILMQPLPSIEPITFFAILAGGLFGWKKGFITGASAAYLSNFFMFGGQGPWTLFQMLGFGIAGFLGGFLRNKAKIPECMMIAAIATLLFELIMNFSSIIFIPNAIFSVFFLAVPFMLVHLVSNIAFSALLPKIKQYIYEKGSFDEKEICMEMLKTFKNLKNIRKEGKSPSEDGGNQ